MLYNIHRVTFVLLFCGGISCNALSEKRLANVEAKFSGLETLFDERFEKLEAEVRSINEAVSKLTFIFLDQKAKDNEEEHFVKRREVISGNQLADLPDALKPSGAVYTRWGRTTCGDDSTLLYSGYAGGSNYDQPGGGVNYQCMPLDPQYNKYKTVPGAWYGSYMAGVEYESVNFGIFPDAAYQQNAPCARCYTNNRSALMMIPAKRDCSDGWTKEYEGYLMTEAANWNHQNTFECVDEAPEYLNGEAANTNGGLFHFIKTQCNRGGHCPPYDGNKEMTCVVCSK